ncbi:MAG: VOC family protein [Phycisphaerae bacterium]|jgi:catechol 2,3-dioxygenase-like lactoylglutathione lyase family enzyme
MSLTFDHIAQQVPDVAAAVRWYTQTLPGCEVLYQDESWALLAGPGAKLAFVRQGDHPNHVAWRVGAAELEELAGRLGGEIKGHRDGSRGFYLAAPGGHHLEIISYPPDYPHK